MNTSRGYALLSGIADFYFLGLVIGAIGALYEAATRQSIPLAAVFILPVLALLGSIAYHVRFAWRTLWLSPGEQMHGRVVTGGEKQWSNPWGRNRWALFAANLLALVLLGNTWDGLGEDPPIAFPQTIFKVVVAFLVALGVVALGKGNPVGALGPAVLYLGMMAAVAQLVSSVADRGPLLTLMVGLFALALLHAVIASTYAYLRRRSGSEPLVAGG